MAHLSGKPYFSPHLILDFVNQNAHVGGPAETYINTQLHSCALLKCALMHALAA